MNELCTWDKSFLTHFLSDLIYSTTLSITHWFNCLPHWRVTLRVKIITYYSVGPFQCPALRSCALHKGTHECMRACMRACVHELNFHITGAQCEHMVSSVYEWKLKPLGREGGRMNSFYLLSSLFLPLPPFLSPFVPSFLSFLTSFNNLWK